MPPSEKIRLIYFGQLHHMLSNKKLNHYFSLHIVIRFYTFISFIFWEDKLIGINAVQNDSRRPGQRLQQKVIIIKKNLITFIPLVVLASSYISF